METQHGNPMNQNPPGRPSNGMDLKFKTPEDQGQDLSGFWAGIFEEIPTCTRKNCGEVAIEVDYFFPYLDDYNRCEGHRPTEGLAAVPMA